MKSGSGCPPSSPLYFLVSCVEKGGRGGRRSGGRPSDRGESEGRLGGGIGAELARKLAPRRATQTAALDERKKKKQHKTLVED